MTRERGTEASDFTLSDSDGDEATLSQFRGRPLHLNFYPVAFSPVCSDWLTTMVADETPCEGAVVVDQTPPIETPTASSRRCPPARRSHAMFLLLGRYLKPVDEESPVPCASPRYRPCVALQTPLKELALDHVERFEHVLARSPRTGLQISDPEIPP